MATNTSDERANGEGTNLLGQPTFTELENGRFRCVETGHEVLAKDMESYSRSKRCRLGLIESALSHKKSPLNMFEQDPLSRSKLKCKLTGDIINKTEEHIWKHINGKRFLNKLEQKEIEKDALTVPGEQQVKKKAEKASKPKAENLIKRKKKENGLVQTISEPRESSCVDVESEPEEAFWMPPVGQRWDFDDGGDRWGSGSDSEHESEEVNSMDDEDENGVIEPEELSKQTKRMSIEIGPSSFASRKKKSKKSST